MAPHVFLSEGNARKTSNSSLEVTARMDKCGFFKKLGEIMRGSMLPTFPRASGNRRREKTSRATLPTAQSASLLRSPSTMVIDVTKAMGQTPGVGSRHSINNIVGGNANLISPHRCWQPVSNVWPTVPCALSLAQTGFACNQNQPCGKRSKKEFRWDRAGETL